MMSHMMIIVIAFVLLITRVHTDQGPVCGRAFRMTESVTADRKSQIFFTSAKLFCSISVFPSLKSSLRVLFLGPNSCVSNDCYFLPDSS